MDLIQAINTFDISPDTNTIYISGDLSGELALTLRIKYEVLKSIRQRENIMSQNDLNIVICSEGGDIYCIDPIIDFFEQLKSKGVLVNVQAEGICMSAATFILAAATGKRTAGKRCRFMVHDIQLDEEASRYNLGELERMQDRLYQIYAETTCKEYKNNKSLKEFKKYKKIWKEMCQVETYFNSEQALQFGLIDEILN